MTNYTDTVHSPQVVDTSSGVIADAALKAEGDEPQQQLPPINLDVLPDNIPEELKSLTQWGLWYPTADKGKDGTPKWGKRPVLSVSEPERWTTFARAMQSRATFKERNKDYGISICVTKLRGYLSIDLDRCVNDGVIAPWAQKIIDQIASYSEFSPGAGVRIFARGDYESDWQTAHDGPTPLEFYAGNGGRHLTVTGNHIPGTPASLRALSREELDAFAAEYRPVKSGSEGSTGPLPGIPDLLEDVAIPEGLSSKVRDFLDTGEPGDYADMSRLVTAVANALIAAGLTQQECLSVLVENEHCMAVALDHRRQNHDRAITYLWQHHVCKAKATPVAEITAADFEDADDFDLDIEFDEVPVKEDSHPGVKIPEPFPGAMAEMVEAGLSASPMPQPGMMTLAVLVGMAASVPGKFMLPSGNRCNLYGVTIAQTGCGKEVPRKIATAVAAASGAAVWGRPASGQGIEDYLTPHCNALVEVDEIAHLFAAANTKSDPNLILVAQTLLRLFSVSGGLYTTRVRARANGVEPPRVIPNPCVSLLGASTPEKLGSALTVDNVTDGLIGRILFAEGSSSIRPSMVNSSIIVPKNVVDIGQEIRIAAEFEEGCITIGYGDGVHARLNKLLGDLFDESQRSKQPLEKGLKMRTWERIDRVAGVLAVWNSPTKPVVELDHVDWAEKLVRYSDDTVLRFCAEYLANGAVQQNFKLICETVRSILSGKYRAKNGNQKNLISKGKAPRSLVLNLSKLAAKEFREAIDHGVELEELITGEDRLGSNSRSVKWLRVAS